MLNVLPTEHWDYRLADGVRGLLTALQPRASRNQGPLLIPGVGSCLPVRSARVGIAVALEAFGLRPNASVAVPLYCCPVVFEAVLAAGCNPRFIDVDSDTYCISARDLAAKSSEVDAVIAVHMFGNLCDIPRLQSAAPRKPVIEDCAQALGSRFDGRPAGSLGEVAVYSFRSGKYLSVGEGGAIRTSDAVLEQRVSELVSTLPAANAADEFRHVLVTYLRSALRRRPLWGVVGQHLWDAYNARASYASKSPLALAQVYRTDYAIALRRLPLLDRWIERQRSNADYYCHNLSVDAAMLCCEPAGAFFNRLQYPLLLPTPDQCGRLAARLKENCISAARPYRDIASIAAAHYGYAGDCPQSERIAERVLVIPCNHALRRADVEWIASCVNLAWAQVCDRRRGVTSQPTECLLS